MYRIIFTFITISLFVGSIFFKFKLMMNELPHDRFIKRALKISSLNLSTEIYDRNNHLIGEFSTNKRYFKPITKIPKHVIDAFIASEDQNFTQHMGINLQAVLRALFTNIQHGEIVQGASTITQQLAKTMFLSHKKSFGRKIKEIALAIKIERILSKEKIMELYLNFIYFGNRSYGLEAAARGYFNKSAENLNIGEAALLAGLPKAPSYLAPHKHYERAKSRQIYVLKRMLEQEKINRQQYQEWIQRKIEIKNEDFYNPASKYFVDMAILELNKKFPLSYFFRKGLMIYTNIDMPYQNQIHTFLKNKFSKMNRTFTKQKHLEVSYMCINTTTGEIVSLQGGSDYEKTQFNRLTKTRRSIGNMIVPITISYALEQGYQLPSILQRNPHNNRDFSYLFSFFLETESNNLAEFIHQLGHHNIYEFAEKLGFLSQSDVKHATSPFTSTLWNLSVGFLPLLNNGFKIDPYLIREIRTTAGEKLYQHQSQKRPQVIMEENSFVMQFALSDLYKSFIKENSKNGPVLELGIPAVSTNLKNGWFLGVSQGFLHSLWIGAEYGKRKIASNRRAALKQIVAIAETIASFGKIHDLKTKRKKAKFRNISFKRYQLKPFGTRTLPYIIF